MLQIEHDHAYIAAGWNAIFGGEIAETTAMLRAMRYKIPCYAFTNSNGAHAVTMSSMFPAVVKSFKCVFASHVIGLRKPEREAFDYIAEAIGIAPKSILFFDDLLENVQGASAAGLQVVHVRSPIDVQIALKSLGFELHQERHGR
jgi:putative hydrolase of the HAD superfamily